MYQCDAKEHLIHYKQNLRYFYEIKEAVLSGLYYKEKIFKERDGTKDKEAKMKTEKKRHRQRRNLHKVYIFVLKS